jgi:urea carboxylase-associated protein 2
VSTATPRGAQEHARAQASAVVEAGRTVQTVAVMPPTSYDHPPEGVDRSRLTWVETVTGPGYTSVHLGRGATLRLTDLDGDACAHVLIFNAHQPSERLNVADTVKVQWQAYLGAGQLLLSDQGRVLASLVSDTSGRHDALCGASSRRRNEERYGSGGVGSASPAGRELLLVAAAKHGLEPRDLPPSISLFKGVGVDPETGALSWIGSTGAPAAVELRAELPLIILIANSAHPLDPRPVWSCGTLEVLAWPGRPTATGDWPATATPEAERAFLNNEEDLASRTTPGELPSSVVG